MKRLTHYILACALMTFVLTDAGAQPLSQAQTAGSSTLLEQATPGSGPSLGQELLRYLSLGAIYTQLAGSEQALMAQFIENGGASNLAITNQQGEGNQAVLDQFGRSNVAVMYQIGTNNTTTLLQEGDYNVYGSRLSGSNNQLGVTQRGDNNIYLFDFHGTDLDHTVLQEGSEISAQQIGTASRPVSIEQRGHDMEVIVRHNGAQ